MGLTAVTAGMLTEGDRVSLSTGIFAVGGLLADRATGARHRLHPRAARAVRLLHCETHAAAWYGAMQDIGLTEIDVVGILGFLYDIGGIRIRRTIIGVLRVATYRATWLARGALPRSILRRWTVTVAGTCGAVCRLIMPLIVLVAALDALAYCAGLTSAARPLVGHSALYVAIFWISTVTHELAHVVIIRRRRTTAVVVQRGLHLGILHTPLNSKEEVWSALCGPVVGAIVALGLSLGIYLWDESSQLVVLGAALAVLHMLSLLPLYGDGKVVWKAIFR